jgi:hypothetical protein
VTAAGLVGGNGEGRGLGVMALSFCPLCIPELFGSRQGTDYTGGTFVSGGVALNESPITLSRLDIVDNLDAAFRATLSPAPVPEPGTLLLCLVGGASAVRRSYKSKQDTSRHPKDVSLFRIS